ncbi:MAG TPA: hypothetical protein VF469_02005, partial [Kofleriaceae bacterium]
MDAYRHIASPPPVRIALPVGTMVETPRRSVRVTMPHNARTRQVVRTLLGRVDAAAAEWLWVPTAVDDAGDELVLDYEHGATESLAFADALPRFTQAPAI